jgi:hypothetical protein
LPLLPGQSRCLGADAIGMENCSISSSIRGTPRIFVSGMPTALNEISTRPALSITDCGAGPQPARRERSPPPPRRIRRWKGRPWRQLRRVPGGARREKDWPLQTQRRVRQRCRSRLRLRRSLQLCPSAASLVPFCVPGSPTPMIQTPRCRESGRPPTAQFAARPVSILCEVGKVRGKRTREWSW